MSVLDYVQVAIDGAGKRIANLLHAGAAPGSPSEDLYGQLIHLADPDDITRVAGVTADGAVKFAPIPAATGTQTSVVSAAVDTPIVAANPDRIELLLYNDADRIVYVSLDGAASTSNFARKLLPQGDWALRFSGQVQAIWAAGPTGAMRVTELT